MQALDELVIRTVQPEDFSAIAVLLGELGYPADAGEIPGRFAALAAYPGTIAYVGDIRGEVAGVITGHIFPSLHTREPVAWLTTLVVSSAFRGTGVGATLVAEIERWAAGQGAVRVSLTSGIAREAAHRFYERLGYERSGVRFTRKLEIPPR